MSYSCFSLANLPRLLTRNFKVRSVTWHPDNVTWNRNRTLELPHFCWSWYNKPGEVQMWDGKSRQTRFCNKPHFSYLPVGYYSHTIRPILHDELIVTILPEHEENFCRSFQPIGGDFTMTPEISRLIKELFEVLESLEISGSADRVDGICLRLIEETSLAVLLENRVNTGGNDQGERLKNFIDNNYRDPITLDDICERFSLSYRTLYRFWNQANSTPAEYLLKKRLNFACHLLSVTNMAIQEVALRSGFSNQIYFSQCFRRNFAMSPTAWREKNNSDLGIDKEK